MELKTFEVPSDEEMTPLLADLLKEDPGAAMQIMALQGVQKIIDKDDTEGGEADKFKKDLTDVVDLSKALTLALVRGQESLRKFQERGR